MNDQENAESKQSKKILKQINMAKQKILFYMSYIKSEYVSLNVITDEELPTFVNEYVKG